MSSTGLLVAHVLALRSAIRLSAMETTKLKIWLEKALDACANEGGRTNFFGGLIMYCKPSTD